MVYWLMMLCMGVYIYLVPNGLTGKFNLEYPENLYIGGFMTVVSVIALIVKLMQYKNNKS